MIPSHEHYRNISNVKLSEDIYKMDKISIQKGCYSHILVTFFNPIKKTRNLSGLTPCFSLWRLPASASSPRVTTCFLFYSYLQYESKLLIELPSSILAILTQLSLKKPATLKVKRAHLWRLPDRESRRLSKIKSHSISITIK